MDGLHKSFDYGFQRYNGSWIPKNVFQNPYFERRNCFSACPLKKERKKNEPNKKENLKNILMEPR